MKMKKQTPSDLRAECYYEGLKAIIEGYGKAIVGFVEDIHKHLNLTGTAGDTLEDQIRRRNEAIADACVKKLDQEMMDKLKMAGECTCPNIVDFGCKPISVINKNCPVHGECSCVYIPARGMELLRGDGKPQKDLRIATDPSCPLHGKATWAGGSRSIDESTKEHVLSPDLPLNVRVAKALGKDIYRFGDDIFSYRWKMRDKTKTFGKPLNWNSIPDYPNDLVAAMEALEEYCITYSWSINCNTESGYYEIRIADKEYHPIQGLPQAICEAIVAHAEQR